MKKKRVMPTWCVSVAESVNKVKRRNATLCQNLLCFLAYLLNTVNNRFITQFLLISLYNVDKQHSASCFNVS